MPAKRSTNEPGRRSVGIHVSISGKLDQAVDRAREVGCIGAFQIFTCSPRRWNAAPLKPAEVEAFLSKAESYRYSVFAHMPYLPNLSSPDNDFYSQSVSVLTREIERCDVLGVQYLVLHFGSHLGTSIEEGHAKVISACRKSLKSTERSSVRLLLENSAGTRNSVGSEFGFVKKVLDGIGHPQRTGVCFDTCHAFASGYDLRTAESVVETFKQFDKTIGIENLYLIHLNDSKVGLGEAKDRHENIGKGKIGLEGFRSLLSLKAIHSIPVVLETPTENEGDDKKNVALVKSLTEV